MELCNTQDTLHPIGRTRLSFDPKARFPSKLFEVANDGFLVKWESDGNSILVDEDGFEEKVMKTYPGFVQIASFLNLRRLFREYSFDWKIVEGTETLFQFSHPAFIRDREDLLDAIRTKRKSRYSFAYQNTFVRRLGEASSPQLCEKRRYKSKRCSWKNPGEYVKTLFQFHTFGKADSSLSVTAARSSSDSSQGTSCYEYRECSDLNESAEFHQHLSSSSFESVEDNDSRPTQQDLFNVLALYAKNELNQEEYFQLLAKTALEQQVPWDADLVRESISSQSVPSPSLKEYAPFDLSCQNLSFQGWGDGKELSDVVDVAENQAQFYNEASVLCRQKDSEIPQLHLEVSTTVSSQDNDATMYTNIQAQCRNADLSETEFNTTLCELRPGLFDRSGIAGEMDHSQLGLLSTE